MIVNIFSPNQRHNYNLEGLWRNGEFADISDCIMIGLDERKVKDNFEGDSLDDWIS